MTLRTEDQVKDYAREVLGFNEVEEKHQSRYWSNNYF